MRQRAAARTWRGRRRLGTLVVFLLAWQRASSAEEETASGDRHPWLDVPAHGVLVHEDYADAAVPPDEAAFPGEEKASDVLRHDDGEGRSDGGGEGDGGGGGNGEICVVVFGTLTRLHKTAKHNQRVLDEMAEMAGSVLSYHFVGGAELGISRSKRTYTAPKDDSAVAATLKEIFPNKTFATTVVPQMKYVSLWYRHKKRSLACYRKLKPRVQAWGDTKMWRINSRQSLTLSALGHHMDGTGGEGQEAPTCRWVVGYRSDFQLGSKFPNLAMKYLFKTEHENSWVNRAFHALVSRTDIFVASRETVAKLQGFDDFIWTKCPVDKRIRREYSGICHPMSKEVKCMDLSSSLERQMGQFFLKKGVKVVTPKELKRGKILNS